MKIGLIVDNLHIARWQADALARLPPECEILVYNCTNSRPSRRSLEHALYYGLNLACLRTRTTAQVRLPEALKVAGRMDFAAEYEGAWQRLPQPLLDKIAADQPALLLKFGMGLLRVPAASELAIPILSYHHGDSRAFRGRPAGFHELLTGRDTIGQVVQILSNSLDAGEIVAFAETKAHGHSYRRTMVESYRCSPLLLKTAIANALSGKRIAIEATGKIYRLPSNTLVLRFLVEQLRCLLRHVTYGAMFEKYWEVAEAPVPADAGAAPLSRLPDRTTWRVARCPPEYRFLADPFYHPEGLGLLVEALRKSTNSGEILFLSPTAETPLTNGTGGHYSYPATCTVDGQHFMVPEMSEWSAARLYRLSQSRLEDVGELDVPGRPRLIDPTLFLSDAGVFLFANDDRDGSSVLRLWHADSLFDRFAEHGSSPIRISPAGSRMAGAIHVAANGARFRFGQDLRRDYGDGIVIFRVDAISPAEYRETEVGAVRLAGLRGPHTLNFRDGDVVFDYYSDRFSPLAGVRRLRSRARRSLS
ncbi:hypothetical protein [Sphingomonas sp.]|uniref:glucosamine inositolphosphorylceramide transferase family protein n=1 Tax=Sphingomonas sp. TaxID=28214 RepID=UPI00286BBE87|nr:hypothetical protein [Sphingomonas sp.]